MPLKLVAWALAIVGLCVVCYGGYMHVRYPARVVSMGTVEVGDGGAGRVRLLVRTVASGGITLTEVELPNGTWIDCGGDCAAAARKATTGFWDEQQKKRK
jgi:hypothetical protein